MLHRQRQKSALVFVRSGAHLTHDDRISSDLTGKKTPAGVAVYFREPIGSKSSHLRIGVASWITVHSSRAGCSNARVSDRRRWVEQRSD
jgi:hypothetical protein